MNEKIEVNLKILVKRIPVVRTQRWSGFGSLSWLHLIPLFFNSFPQSTVLTRVCYFKLFCYKNGKRVAYLVMKCQGSSMALMVQTYTKVSGLINMAFY